MLPKIIEIKCNNPTCNNYINVDYEEYKRYNKLFCCNNCRKYTYKLKLEKKTKHCINKSCNKKFITYDNREHCCEHCKTHKSKITKQNYIKQCIKLGLKNNIEHKNYDPDYKVRNNPISRTKLYKKYNGTLLKNIGPLYKPYLTQNVLNYINHTIFKFKIKSKEEIKGLLQQEIDRVIAKETWNDAHADVYRPEKIIAEKDDYRLLFIKCNNPKCNNHIPINLYELMHYNKLFCSNKCKMSFYNHNKRLNIKPIRYKKSCKRCKRTFYTYDNTRNYCNSHCEFRFNKLTAISYKQLIRCIQVRHSNLNTRQPFGAYTISEEFITNFLTKEKEEHQHMIELYNSYNDADKLTFVKSLGINKISNFKID